ncbi:MAG: TetR/AcrR family transcriptional regulator, partial [Thermomicrobiales bacterium]|nr:TetR/AcrR family transcriptional regulator [Thermomicrobiales bacterium]
FEGSESRQRIVRAAFPLFVGQSYESVSMQHIADAVPLNKATLYHHFQSKDELFLAVVHLALSEHYKSVEKSMVQGGPLEEQLARVALQVFQDSQAELRRLMTDAKLHLSEQQQQTLHGSGNDPWTLYEGIFANAISSGDLPQLDATLAASMFIGLVHGQIWSLKVGRISGPLDESRARILVDTLLGGLRARYGSQLRESIAAAD